MISRTAILAAAAAAMLAGCGQGGDNQPAAANQAAAATKKPKPKYCFFKDSETKGWTASRDAQGNLVVKGRAYRSDPRYKAELGPGETKGDRAVVQPTISPNTGYASPDNWWDVTATIPNSAGVETVVVECGKKTLAELTVPR